MVLIVTARASAQDSRVTTSVGHRITGAVTEGTLVVSDNASAGFAKPATISSSSDLIGVVVGSEEPLLTVNSGSGQRQVAINGLAYALVSDINGEVKKGDYITASSIAGVGMKSTSESRVLGLAKTDLGSSSNVQTIQAENVDGATVSTRVGRVLVQINVGYYGGPPNANRGIIPQALQDFSNTVAGRQVSSTRILISGLLLLVALIISVTLVYSAVGSSIISIGRNPLSKLPVRKSLLQILGLVGIILLVTLISVYLILSR